jgi:hypothetical protein
MQKLPEISKAAFLARVNDRARRVAVDSVFELIDGRCRLVILFNNGDREIFAGLQAA